MNLKRPLIIASLLSVSILAYCEKPSSTGEDKNNPHQTKSTALLNDQSLTISVQVPAGHHAYLDAGKEGSFIPISFQWDELLKETGLPVAPKMKTAPTGEPEAESGARVLRGKGDFVFEGNPKLAGQKVQVRSQICDDVKGICYRPSLQSVEIRTL
ncbi:MAG: hypothetical protein JNM27_00955 [Leptospirales bacterium]|nr:hypothetical protein [Leptospirales bacterium]